MKLGGEQRTDKAVRDDFYRRLCTDYECPACDTVWMENDFPVSWLQVSRSAVPHGGIWNRNLLVTWESLTITERTISVCDNHTEQRGFIKSMTGCPSLDSTSTWLHDDLNRFSTLLFQQQRERQVSSKSADRDRARKNTFTVNIYTASLPLYTGWN